uniref:Uncharacterized protein n=1 Tax=Gloeothece verrucosa (strain PCC 7822) TaxID=497965 RepID=E0ULI8_GLOV7|nr:hypothetical protein Cyan7822_5969 [Gloeothece verrucosa PCC 7822]
MKKAVKLPKLPLLCRERSELFYLILIGLLAISMSHLGKPVAQTNNNNSKSLNPAQSIII